MFNAATYQKTMTETVTYYRGFELRTISEGTNTNVIAGDDVLYWAFDITSAKAWIDRQCVKTRK